MNNNGLTSKEVLESRNKYGTNKIEVEKNNSFISLLIESLGDPIIKILLIALMVKIVFLFRDFDWFETLGILIAIFLASFVSSISEYGSEKAFKRLQEESSKIKSKVKRDNRVCEIDIDDIVKGDVVLLEYGDKVPADGIVIQGDIYIDESTINGESNEIHKEKNSKVYKGTLVSSGQAIIRVTDVGTNTVYGKIASELSIKNEDSPLKLRLRKLANIISTFGYIGAFLASISYMFSVIVIDNNFILGNIINTICNIPLMINHIIYCLTLSVTIIIVSVPEGLPMMITLVLSSNMRRMLKKNVLVRKLVGIETAGSLNILFSDKTGTLTTGSLRLTTLMDANLNMYKTEDELKKYKRYYDIVLPSLVVNNMSTYSNDGVVGGNATDRSILGFIKPIDLNIEKKKVIPFNSKNKYMITVTNSNTLIKGAPEIILPNCKYYYNKDGIKLPFNRVSELEKKVEEYASMGYRILVFATSNNKEETDFNNLTLVSIGLIKDEIRKEVKEGIKLVNNAGINTIMITGDNKNTALAISKELGMYKDGDITLTSDELNSMSDQEVKKIIPNLRIVARSLPQDKSRLVRLCKEMNLVVGMTGDGVNDAPALKKSDVGFAMGSGSEVAKEASDIVILDNNFLSIASAILFGRTIFKSIRKFIIFQITINLCALSISILGPFIGVDAPVTVMQMLWINMVMDTLAGLAFSFEPPLKEYMMEKPKKKDENIMNGYMLNEILVTGLFTIILLIAYLKIPFIRELFNTSESFMTGFFGLFIFSSIFNAFNAHTSRINVFANLMKNKMFIVVITFIVIVQILLMYYGGNMFRTVPLNIRELLIITMLSCMVVPIDVFRKLLCKKYNRSRMV